MEKYSSEKEAIKRLLTDLKTEESRYMLVSSNWRMREAIESIFFGKKKDTPSFSSILSIQAN